MKIIAVVEAREKYIAEISHDELEKFMNKYYGNMKGLQVGSELDLGKGYDFLRETREVCSSVKDIVEKSSEYVKTMGDAIVLLAQKEKD